MYNLLVANFSRLKKNIFFWGMIVISIIIGLLLILNNTTWVTPGVDTLLTSNIIYVGFFISIFVSFFVGIEYADGTIRNKIIAGHKRSQIYLSNLIVSIVGAIIIELAYLFTILSVGSIALKPPTLDFSTLIMVFVDIFMFIIAYSAIFNFVTLVCSDITVSTVINIILIIVMFVIILIIETPADAEKTTTIYNDGEEIEVLNPNYPGDNIKNICRTILYSLPLGQSMEIQSAISELSLKGESNVNINVMYLYSLVVIVTVSLIGIYIFERKDLK